MADYNLGTARGTIQLDYRGNGVQRADTAVGRLGRTGQRAGGLLSALGVSKITSVGTVIAAGFGYAVKSAADFEQKMSAVKAVSGATSGQMQQLRDKALQLGKDTSFSASESAVAIEELVKAGVSVPDVMNGAADATVALAAAGGISLPQAATISANAMNAFGMSAKELPKVADLIAGAANASAIDVGEFGQSLQQVGAVAHLAGVPFKDVSVAIAELGNAGIKGSDAGTSLKTMFSRLQPTTKQAAKEFDALGITTNGLNNKFYDSEGKVKSLAQVQEVLKTSLKNLTPAQKQLALQTLFGSDAIRAAAIMADNGAKGFNKMSTAMGKVTAADVAKTRMDNLKGSIEQLKGSMETVAIMVGSVLLKALKGAADGANAFLGKIIDVLPKLQALISFLVTGDFTSAFRKAFHLEEDSSVVDGILKIRSAIISGLGGVINFIKGAFAALYPVISNLVIGFSIGFGVIVAAAVMAFGALGPVLTAVGNALKSVGEFLKPLAPLFQAVGAFVGVIAGGFLAVAVAGRAVWMMIRLMVTIWRIYIAVQAAVNAVMALNPFVLIVIAIVALVVALVVLYKKSETFRNIVNAVWAAVKVAALAVVNWFMNSALPTMQAVWTGITEAFKTAYNTISSVVSAIVNFVKSAWQTLVSALTTAMNAILTVVTPVWNVISTIIGAAMTVIMTVISAGWTIISTIFTTAMTVITTIVQTAWTVLSSIISVAWALISGVITTGVAVLTTIWSNAWTAISGVVTAVWTLIKSIINLGIVFVQAIITGNMTKIDAAWRQVWTSIGGVITAVWNAIKLAIQTVLTVIQQVISGALNTIKAVMSAIWNGIKASTSAVWNGIKTIISAVWTAIKTIVTTYINAVRTVITAVWGAIKAVISAAMNGIRAVISAVWNAIKSFVTSTNNSIKSSISAIWNGIKAFITGSVNGIKNIIVNTFRAIMTLATSIFNSMKNTLIGVVNSLRSSIGGSVNNIKSNVSNAFNQAKSIAINAFNSLKSGAVNAINGALSAIRGAVSSIKGVFSGAAGWLIGAGQSIIQGLINGIKNMAGNVTGAVQGVLSAARNLLPFSPAKTGPFSGKGWTLYSGMAISNALAAGITAAQGSVVSSATSLAKNAHDALHVTAPKADLSAYDSMRSARQKMEAGAALAFKTSTATKAQVVVSTAVNASVDKQLAGLAAIRAAIVAQGSQTASNKAAQLAHLAAIRQGLSDPQRMSTTGPARPVLGNIGSRDTIRPIAGDQFHVEINNPVAEKGSDSVQDALVRTARLGIIGSRRS